MCDINYSNNIIVINILLHLFCSIYLIFNCKNQKTNEINYYSFQTEPKKTKSNNQTVLSK